MSNYFTIDMATKSENVTSNAILRLYKQNMVLKSTEIKPNETRLTQKQIYYELRYSDSTIKRDRNDFQMDSLYSRNN